MAGEGESYYFAVYLPKASGYCDTSSVTPGEAGNKQQKLVD
jgi:hypothetical protein